MRMSKRKVISEFVKKRNEVLFSLSEEKIRNFFTEQGVEAPTNRRIFWGGVYKAICNIENAPEDVVQKARAGLKEMGWRENIG